MNQTKIDWCDKTLNPVTGCTHGCSYCYARRLNDLFHWIEDFSNPQFFPSRLDSLAYTHASKNIFMNSMSDVADWNSISKAVWPSVLEKIKMYSHHNYLFLTKRPSKLKNIDLEAPNIWIGVTITKNEDYKKIVELVNATNFGNLFVSFEPLQSDIPSLKDMDHYLQHLKWIIIGEESGNHKNKVVPHKSWIERIIIIARAHQIPVFIKTGKSEVVQSFEHIKEFPYELTHRQSYHKQKKNINQFLLCENSEHRADALEECIAYILYEHNKLHFLTLRQKQLLHFSQMMSQYIYKNGGIPTQIEEDGMILLKEEEIKTIFTHLGIHLETFLVERMERINSRYYKDIYCPSWK